MSVDPPIARVCDHTRAALRSIANAIAHLDAVGELLEADPTVLELVDPEQLVNIVERAWYTRIKLDHLLSGMAIDARTLIDTPR